MWLHLTQSVEGLKRKQLTSSKEEGILPSDGLQSGAAASALSWVSSQPVSPGSPTISMSQFIKIYIKINLSLSHHFAEYSLFNMEGS